MAKKSARLISRCYRRYKILGGLHSPDEYERFAGILLGIISEGAGKMNKVRAEDIDFGRLITEDDIFRYWVNYTGSIKEAKIYIRSLLEE